ncbi:MAG: hypothetical protein KAX28_09140 [Candidatus Marinimicrobia bacterium]|nr:hypothetical protein [Candidatus Neomarinimicrobiota bacterium]
MEELLKKVEGILNQYAQECMGNRLNQFTFASLKNVILGEIANYKPSEKTDKVVPLRPIIKETVKEDKK